MGALPALLHPCHAMTAVPITAIPVIFLSTGIRALCSILDATEDELVLNIVQEETGCMAPTGYRQKMVSSENALSRLETSNNAWAL